MPAPKPRVAAIGECMIELFQRESASLSLAFGGDTLNMAVYLARVGGPYGIAVDYVTALGDDPYSDAMCESWAAEGVGTGLVARLEGRLPGLYMIRTDAAGERSFYYFRSAAAARDLFRTPGIAAVEAAVARCDLVYLTGITLSILDGESRVRLLALLDRVRAAGGRIAFDSNYRPRGWPDPAVARQAMDDVLRRCHIALPTLGDDQALFGVRDAADCAERLHGLGVSEVVVKRDRAPCVIARPGALVEVAALPVARVVDTTAAGDSFNAAYLAARLLNRPVEAAARAGHELAAAVIGHPGAVIPRMAMPALDLDGR